MSTFLFLGKYSSEAVKGISGERTEKAAGVVKKYGGEVVSTYALLGEHDLALIVNLPGTAEAVKVSVALGRLTGISFTTSAAIPVEEFDKMIAEI